MANRVLQIDIKLDDTGIKTLIRGIMQTSNPKVVKTLLMTLLADQTVEVTAVIEQGE